MNTLLTGAVDIGGTKIQAGIVDNTGSIIISQSFPTAANTQSAAQAMDKIAEMLKVQCATRNIRMASLRGIGISCSGPVDYEQGIIENPYTLPGWDGFPAAAYLLEKTGLQVRMDNDANGALLGEILLRDLYDERVLMITIGTGIGVAFWYEKHLYRCGRYHPEMGHIIVASRDRKCYCGHAGCFESCCSGKAMNERAEESGFHDFDDLYRQAQKGDVRGQETVRSIMQDMSNGIWSLNIIFKPNIIIFAGGFSVKYFSFIKDIVLKDSLGKSDFLNDFTILPAGENRNPALAGANMMFCDAGRQIPDPASVHTVLP
ncbi:MAG: ROK family protein [Lachnospiraceae bacterium]|jgi:glucokinase|nr:ROK family protein [Lachnospiraceae bacterium]